MFGFKWFQIIDNSLAPDIPIKSYVLTCSWFKRWQIKVGDNIVIHHPNYGTIAKKIAVIDRNKLLWCKSAPEQGMAIEQLGPVAYQQVIGKVLWSVSP